MRSILASLALTFFATVLPHANADITVTYQPTPFPSRDIYGNYPGHAHRHILNGWINDVYYGLTFQKDDKIQIGGWGDNYRTYILFDLEGLPTNVTQARLFLYAYPRGDSSTLVNYDMWRITSSWAPSQTNTTSWDTSIVWNTQPSVSYYGSWAYGVNNSWWGMTITSLYNGWRNGTYPNYGVALMSWTQNNNFDVWRSSRYIGASWQRPCVMLTFAQPAGTPGFKLPLPGGANWLLTNEVGGFESQGENPNPDTAHQEANYFALDFSAENYKDTEGSYVGSIPILAPAAATVSSVGYGSQTGYYIILDHGNGYLTRYLHFDNPPARANGTLLASGNTVNQGDQIGIMRSSGISTGLHLHMNFWYGATFNGYSTISSLQTLTMESLLLKSYQTESSVNGNGIPTGRIRYYHSSNIPTGL